MVVKLDTHRDTALVKPVENDDNGKLGKFKLNGKIFLTCRI